MNDKIRELAEQSGFFPMPESTEGDWEFRAENARYERFADLILKEAMDIVRDEVSFHSDWHCNAKQKVNEHFGVK